MGLQLATKPPQPGPGLLLQRQCVCGGECDSCRNKKETLQLQSAGPAPPRTVPPIVHQVLGSPGQPLETQARAFMEPRFGQDFSQVRTHTSPRVSASGELAVNRPGDEYEVEADRVANAVSAAAPHEIPSRSGFDFSGVRIHTDATAAASARAVNALAYTVGQDIVFAEGQYAPATEGGRRLLAHELTHTIQQGNGSPPLVMGAWQAAGTACDAEPTNKRLAKVVVEQETPQSVTLHWNDGSLDSGKTSTGKGHCCVDPKTPEGIGCTVKGSRVYGSNCTPITESEGYTITDRYLNYNGWEFWSTFVPSRGIGLHTHHTVDGTPLSHGCVRLEKATALKIFCGARQNQTRVQVRGFARPKCDHPQLVKEWIGDFDYAAKPTDGETPSVQRGIRDTRETLKKAFGVSEEELNTLLQLPRDQVGSRIPRCGHRAALPTAEEARLTAGAAAGGGTVPARVLASSRFERFLVPFTTALSTARSLARAQAIVRQHGRELWQAATARAQAASGPDTDDRPLYWARLQMARALRQWEPSFTLTDPQRRNLVDLFERASRGMETAAFQAGRGVKRIVISGFDPFALDSTGGGDIRRGNPSGAAVLALDGQRFTADGRTAEVQGVIFPVRFTAFDAGSVETVFRPYLSGTRPADMIMTISQGGSNVFEVEEFAGRRRSTDAPDNLGQSGGGTPDRPVVPAGVASGPEFLQTTLPTAALRGPLGRTTPIRGETEVAEIPRGGTGPVNRPTGGPTAGSTAVEGSGGGYLSNEIFYRTSLLRSQEGAQVPVGHLHTPILAPPGGSDVANQQFTAARDAIVNQVKAILRAALPAL